jgi:mRNA-degrading endonuclease toxin of MazEF toxin-antitoxin module
MSSNPGTAGTPPPPPPPIPVRFADVLFVDAVLDSVGQNPKQRRVVILTPNDALAAGFPIVAAPVTTQIPPIPGPDHILLPFQNPPGTRHPATGLTRRAGIVATWLVVVDPHDITGRSGYVPARAMAVVQAKTAAAAQALGGWP